MNKSYSVYFPNTDLIQEVVAETWDISNEILLTFYRFKGREKNAVAVFNMNNILGFKVMLED